MIGEALSIVKRTEPGKHGSKLTRERYALAARSTDAGEDQPGLPEDEWFRVPVPRRTLKALMRRSDGAAIRDTAIWLGLMVLTAALAIYLWPSWLAIPVLLVYGTLYASAADARAHECGHGTPFASTRLNAIVFHLATFFIMEDPTVTRWRHTLHHTDTILVGRDPEILVMRPARLTKILLDCFGLASTPRFLVSIVRHACGQLTSDERQYIPGSERHKVYRTAQVWTAIYIAVVVTCVLTGSILPILLIGGPRLYGVLMRQVYTLTQHTGMAENVLDHRLNTRTVYMNPVNRFLYWNMNYHVEHHMFPMVPYHQLPQLHETIKGELAEPYPSILAVYREIVPAVIRQLRDQTYFIYRELPEGATPFRFPEGTPTGNGASERTT
jgi:fatty acid desaturase